MKRRLSPLSEEILEHFIISGRVLKDGIINPYKTSKELIGGNPKYYHKEYMTLANLRRYGFLESKKISEKTYYQLTIKGKKKVQELYVRKKIESKKWDKKWRILVFDIPEEKRKFRENLRRTLKELGFYKLQKSVWVCPYDIIEYLYDLVPGFRTGDWFEYIEADYISSQTKIKKIFGLK